jgi:hypothetical protein
VVKALTTVAMTQSANPSPFGQPLTLTATVTPTPPGAGTPTGSVQFKNGSTNLGAPVPVNSGQAQLALASLLPGQTITAVYTGDASFVGSTGTISPAITFSHPAVTGSVSSNLTFSGGSWLLSGANVTGTITVVQGASVAIVNSTLGGVTTSNGAAFALCGSTVNGAVNVSGATGPVVVGDPAGGNCAGNTLQSALTLMNNRAGVEVSHNGRIGGTVTLSGNSGPATGVEANTIWGGLNCSGDAPAAVNNGQPNTVSGRRYGECGAAGF